MTSRSDTRSKHDTNEWSFDDTEMGQLSTQAPRGTGSLVGADLLEIIPDNPSLDNSTKEEGPSASDHHLGGRGRRASSVRQDRSLSKLGMSVVRPVGGTLRESSVPVAFVIQYFRNERLSTRLLVELAFFFPFLVLFVFYFNTGRSIEENFFILRGVEDRLVRGQFPLPPHQLRMLREQQLTDTDPFVEPDATYLDIENDGDWANWLSDTLTPHTWDCAHPNATHDPLSPYGQIYHVGAMRVRTLRMTSQSCAVDDEVYPDPKAFPRTCFADHKRSGEDTQPFCNVTDPFDERRRYFEYRSCDAIDGATIPAVEGVYHCGGHTFELPFNASCSAVLQALRTVDECNFVDMFATRFVAVEYFIFTPQTGNFHAIKFYAEVLSGGWYFPQYMIRTFDVFDLAKVGDLALQIVFILYVLAYVAKFVYDFVRTVRARGVEGAVGFATEMWNILEATNLVCFLVVFMVSFVWMAESNAFIQTFQLPAPQRYPAALDRIMALHYLQVMANAVNTLLTFMKMLKYMRLNARLSVLTRTLALCQQSIVGVLILFIFVVVGYGITGWAIFGINIRNFRSLPVAMSSLLRQLIGDIDYESMRRENRFLAGAFFWSFNILALFLLLNFLIAILSDSFAAVSGKAFEQALDQSIIRFFQKARAFLTKENVLRILGGMRSGETEDRLFGEVITALEVAARHHAVEEQAETQRIVARCAAEGRPFVPELDDVKEPQTMCFHDYDLYLDRRTLRLLTHTVLEYHWETIVNDHEDALKASEEVDASHLLHLVENATQKAVAEDLTRIDDVDQLLTRLERYVAAFKDVAREDADQLRQRTKALAEERRRKMAHRRKHKQRADNNSDAFPSNDPSYDDQ